MGEAQKAAEELNVLNPIQACLLKGFCPKRDLVQHKPVNPVRKESVHRLKV